MTTRSAYREKPVEARRLTRETGPALWEWADSKPWYGPDRQVDGLSIYTPEGRVKAEFGDWIAKYADGSFRPLKPDQITGIIDVVFEDPPLLAPVLAATTTARDGA